jgi:hypothetical protein
MTTLVGIPANQLADCWDGIKYLIADACTRSNGKYEAVDILRALLRGDMQLWGAVGDEKIEAIAIGEIVNYPRIKIYRMLGVTGEGMNEWINHIHGIENWARAQGCQDFEAVARPGWEKMMKDKGWRKTHIILNYSLQTKGTLQ